MRFARGSGVVAGAGGGVVRRGAGRRASTSGQWRLIALAFFVHVTTGCLSNEYRIPNDELQRLAQTPPAIRGHHVHVVQSLGDRRSDAIPYRAPPPPPPEVPPPAPDQPQPRRRRGATRRSSTTNGTAMTAAAGSTSNIDGSGSGVSGAFTTGSPPGGTRGNPSSGGWRGSAPQAGGVAVLPRAAGVARRERW